jgi:hypothetical protein
VHLHIFKGAGARIPKDRAVHRDLTRRRALAARANNAQRPRRHAVDAPLGVAVHVAYGDGESAVVGADNVQTAAAAAGDVKARVLAGVRRFINVAAAAAASRGGRRARFTWRCF